MACDRKTLLLLSCYADGEATADEAARAAEHLKSCSDCRKLIEEWQGQRQLLEWACTFELPEEIRLEERQVEVAQRVLHRSVWPRLRWNWRLAGGLAALAVTGLVGHWFATLPPILAVGGTVSAGSIEQVVRVQNGVRLNVGPNSKIVRVDDRTIRLEKGSVEASVRHGTRFRVVTPRVRVVDQGTRFWVGTGPEIDCVTVQEGVVSVEKGSVRREVKAGQVLIARGTEAPSVVSPLAPKEDTEDQGRPLGEWSGQFDPTSGQSLDWREGLRKLAGRFPDARVDGGYTGGSGAGHDRTRRYRFGLNQAPGLRKALRAHIQEIAQALAGGPVEDEWEMQVGYVLVDGIVGPPELPGGVYYIRLVSGDGRLVWRLSGADGSDADFPVVLADRDSLTAGSGISGGSNDQLQYAIRTKDSTMPRVTVMLGDWPGKVKPALSVQLRTVSVSDALQNDQSLIDDVAAQTAGVYGLDLKDVTPDVLYLDSSREHRLLLMWNRDEGEQIERVLSHSKRGRGESILMGVVASDVPWIEPDVPAGVYLLWCVLPARSKTPRWEISTPGKGNRTVLCGEPQGIPRKGQPGYDPYAPMIPGSNHTWGLDGDIGLTYSSGLVGKSFRFGFVVTHGYGQGSKWGEGWILVEKP